MEDPSHMVQSQDGPKICLEYSNLVAYRRSQETLFAVFAGILSSEKKKSSAVTASGFLQNFPFTNTTQRKFFHCQKNKIKIKIKIKQKTKKKHFYNNGQVKLNKKN